MIIEPDSIYDIFTVECERPKISWDILGPLSGDLVAGMALGLDIVRKERLVDSAIVDKGFILLHEGNRNEQIPFVTIDVAITEYYFFLSFEKAHYRRSSFIGNHWL